MILKRLLLPGVNTPKDVRGENILKFSFLLTADWQNTETFFAIFGANVTKKNVWSVSVLPVGIQNKLSKVAIVQNVSMWRKIQFRRNTELFACIFCLRWTNSKLILTTCATSFVCDRKFQFVWFIWNCFWRNKDSFSPEDGSSCRRTPKPNLVQLPRAAASFWSLESMKRDVQNIPNSFQTNFFSTRETCLLSTGKTDCLHTFNRLEYASSACFASPLNFFASMSASHSGVMTIAEPKSMWCWWLWQSWSL